MAARKATRVTGASEVPGTAGATAATAAAAEQFALTLTRHGMQRMAARVLAGLLFCEQDSVTAGELAEQLGASAGGVSGAIKTLDGVGLIERVPVPGSRREHYRFPDDGWERLMSQRNAVLEQMQQAARRGIEAAGRDSLAGRRLAQMNEFYGYLLREMPALLLRWKEHRQSS